MKKPYLLWAELYLRWINWQNFIDTRVWNIPHCKTVMKQGLNNSNMKQSTSVSHMPHFFCNDSGQEQSIAYCVPISHSEWLLHQPLQCQSLQLCMAFCGIHNRPWGWAELGWCFDKHTKKASVLWTKGKGEDVKITGNSTKIYFSL